MEIQPLISDTCEIFSILGALVCVEDSIGYLASADFKLLGLLSLLCRNAINTRKDPSSTCWHLPLHFSVKWDRNPRRKHSCRLQIRKPPYKRDSAEQGSICEEICRSENRNGAEREKKEKRGGKEGGGGGGGSNPLIQLKKTSSRSFYVPSA